MERDAAKKKKKKMSEDIEINLRYFILFLRLRRPCGVRSEDTVSAPQIFRAFFVCVFVVVAAFRETLSTADHLNKFHIYTNAITMPKVFPFAEVSLGPLSRLFARVNLIERRFLNIK